MAEIGEFPEIKKEEIEFFDHELEMDTQEYINVARVAALIKTEGNDQVIEKNVAKIETKTPNANKPKPLKTCEDCGESFKLLSSLKKHKQRMHKTRKKIDCKYCPETFYIREAYRMHITEKHSYISEENEKRYLCMYCGGSFTLASGLKKHIQRMHEKEKKIECNYCPEFFYNIQAYRTHRTEKHLNNPGEMKKKFLCGDCGASYTSGPALKNHRKRIHELGKKINCKYCPETFYDMQTYRVHKTENHPNILGAVETSHVCADCGATFTEGASLRKHKKRIHDSGKKFDCKYCPETFLHLKAYATHRTEKHFNISESKKIKTEESEENLQNVLLNNRSCILCREEFSSIESYIVHMYTHLQYTKEELNEYNKVHKFPCKICNEQCSSLDIIMAHMATHMEKTHECKTCQEKFSYFRYKQHEKQIHQNMSCKICKEMLQGTLSLQSHHLKKHSCPMWICDTCQSVYTNKITLQRHVRDYHRYHELLQQIYKCELCEKIFYSKPILRRHMYVSHPIKTNISCKMCDLKFKYPFLLNKHRKIHHPDSKEQTYLCYICMESFKSDKSYRVHVRSHKTTKYQCKDCCLIFRNKKGYSKHLKRFKCPNRMEKNARSNKKNLNKYSLELSKTTCRFCLLDYGAVEDLAKHFLENHQDEKAFHCFHCDVNFHTVEKFNKHCGTRIHKKRISSGCCIKTGVIVNMTEKQQPLREDYELTPVKLELDEHFEAIPKIKSEVTDIES